MLSLSLVSPAKKIFTDLEVEEVFIPSYRGELNILEGHGPLMATLETGVLKYRRPGETQLTPFAISWGYVEISNNRVTVLAETAEAAHEIDVARAQVAKEQAEQALLKPDAEQKDFLKFTLKLERSLVRLQVAQESEKLAAAAEKRGTTH